MGARLSRRAALRCLACGVAGVLVPRQFHSAVAQGAEAVGPSVLVVSRARVLRETRAGRALRAAERELSTAFQARVDAVKTEIEAEEAELARLRPRLSRSEFERRAARFDRKVRITRRRSQRQAAELQRALRRAQDRLTAHLAPILIELLRTEGANVVLDADQILLASPSVNMTEKVIELFDARVETPVIDFAEPGPLLPTEAELEAATRESGPD
ncbi:MAG: OmpH family outer membrane protein [Pikeienuella sp.]